MLDFLERYADIRRRLYSNTGIVDPEARAPICRDVGRVGDDDEKVKIKGKKPRNRPTSLLDPRAKSLKARRMQFLHAVQKRLDAGRVPLIKGDLRPWQEITNQVSEKTGITYEEMRGRYKCPELVDARCECWFRISKEVGISNGMIAALFGGRDASTVHHGIRRHARK
mgnify:FL=1